MTEPKTERKEDQPVTHTDGKDKVYESVTNYLRDVHEQRSYAWPIDSERLLTLIGSNFWIACVNYERLRDGKQALPDGEALGVRAKLFDKKQFDR
jgi:hypothetical protein